MLLEKDSRGIAATSILVLVVVVILIVGGLAFFFKSKNQSTGGGTEKIAWQINNKDLGNGMIQADNPKDRIKYSYPKDWTEQHTNLQAYQYTDSTVRLITILRPPTPQTIDNGVGTLNISLDSYNSPQNFKLDDLYAQVVGSTSKLKNYKAVSSENITISGRPARKLTYTVITENGNLAKTMSVIFIRDDKSYIAVTYNESPENFDTYLKVANDFLNSIQIY